VDHWERATAEWAKVEMAQPSSKSVRRDALTIPESDTLFLTPAHRLTCSTTDSDVLSIMRDGKTRKRRSVIEAPRMQDFLDRYVGRS
jgi:hypothetical protein